MLSNVSQHLIDEVMSRPSNDTYWLNYKDLESIGEYDPGLEEALISACGYVRISKMTAQDWSRERKIKVFTCVTDYWMDNRIPLQEQFAAKLRTGWRPWKK